MSNTVIVKGNEGKVIDPLPGEEVVLKLTAENTDSTMDFWIVTNEYMSGPPLHIHPNAAELFYILEGSLRMMVNDEMMDANAGDLVYIPKGVPHTFVNLSQETAKAINIFCPSGLAPFLEEVADQIAAAGSPENVDINGIAGRHDLQLIGPPMAVMLAQQEQA